MQVYAVDVDGWGSSQIQLELAECAARAIFRFFFIRLVQPPDFGDAQIIVKMAETETPPLLGSGVCEYRNAYVIMTYI